MTGVTRDTDKKSVTVLERALELDVLYPMITVLGEDYNQRVSSLNSITTLIRVIYGDQNSKKSFS